MSEPLTRPYNLGRLLQAGDTVSIVAGEAERAALTRWADILEVGKWDAAILLRKLSPTRFVLEGTFTADVVQACVVTLEPVPSHIKRAFTRELLFAGAPRRGGRDLAPILAEEGAPDEIESLNFDLAIPLLEEFSLALDPYPRAPGARFEPPTEPQGGPESPFAGLDQLKSRL